MSSTLRRCRTLLAAALPFTIAVACDGTSVDDVPAPSANASTPNGTPTAPATTNAVAGIRITPRVVTVGVGAGVLVNVLPVDERGNPTLASLAGPVRLRSANAAIAVASDTGIVTGVAAGATTIYATVGTLLDSATIIVNPSTQPTPLRTGLHLFAPSVVTVGGTVWVSALLFDDQGRLVQTRGKQATWRVDDPTILRLVPTPVPGDTAIGTMITGLAVGSTTVHATVDGVTADASIFVVAAPPPRPDSASTPSVPATPVATFDLSVSVWGMAARTTANPTPTDTMPISVAGAQLVVYRLDPSTRTATDTLGTRVRVAEGTTDAKGDASFRGLKGGTPYVVTIAPPASAPFVARELVFGPPTNSDIRLGVLLARKP